MGTDIHGVWQKRVNGKWEDIPSLYDQVRHYFLFAWIGNIRNGYGFAGVPTHSPIVPLSDCRGYPEDFEVQDDAHPIASFDVMDPRRQQWRDEEDPLEVWMGDHSHSWLTADEILAGKLPTTTRTGIIPLSAFKEWDGKSSPDSWSGGVDGPGIKVDGPENVDEKTTHVRIFWEDDASESLKYFVDEVRRLKDLHGEVRFVFGFDS